MGDTSTDLTDFKRAVESFLRLRWLVAAAAVLLLALVSLWGLAALTPYDQVVGLSRRGGALALTLVAVALLTIAPAAMLLVKLDRDRQRALVQADQAARERALWERIRETRDRLDSIIRNTRDAVIATDLDGNVTFWSMGAEAMYGWTAAEALGQPLCNVPPDRQAELRSLLEGIGRGETSPDYRTVRRRRDGTLLHVSMTLSPVRDAAGRITGVSGITRDISAEMQVAAALEDKVVELTTRTAHLQALNEVILAVSESLDLQEVMETALEQVLKVTQAEAGVLFAVDPTTRDLVLRASRGVTPSYTAAIARIPWGQELAGHIAATQEPIRIDSLSDDPRISLSAVRQAGVRAFMGTPILAHGVLLGVLDVFSYGPRPFTERDLQLLATIGHQVGIAMEKARLHEEIRTFNATLEAQVEERTRALREAHEALARQERLALLGQLAGGVGHELRNPLAVMRNSVYFLQTRLGGADEKVAKHLAILDGEIATATKLTTDLLDFARVKTPAFAPADLNRLLREAVSRCAIPEGVVVEFTLADPVPAVSVDPQQITQVLVNLITNAVQAMPQAGKLRLSTALGKGQVQVTVADTGCGIPAEDLPRIFQPLFTTKAQGIGLGLAICQNLLTANHATIAVESTVGQGTDVQISFPCVPEPS
ncbi:MAG: GAF domain-containing protein [Deltaproteobacteria bacterium]|nr:GAF domain-containing protein [Deltaproteobacteria bacterium]